MMSIARAISIVALTLLTIPIMPARSHAMLGASAQDPGTIAYVRRSPNQIRVIQPDGTNDRVLWTSPTPDSVVGIPSMAWRPDGAVLAFSSDHETACSWYDTDVYTIRPNGAGVQRVTNSPACAGLAQYPQGAVTVDVASLQSGHFSLYVQGSRELKGITLNAGGSGQVTFDHVADLGPNIAQPAVGINGLYRYPGDTAPDIKAGQTVVGPTIWLSSSDQYDALGTGKVSWRMDGSRIAYAMRNCSTARQIATNPPVGSLGQDLPTGADLAPCLVDWAPTAGKADQFLYSVNWSGYSDNVQGIYLNSATGTGAGTRLVSEGDFLAQFGYNNIGSFHDLKWLPDATGFLFTMTYIYVNTDDPDPACVGTCSDVFEYNFATGAITQVTRLHDESVRGLSVSPDGSQVALERVTEDPAHPLNTTSAIWVMERDSTGLRLLVDDAASPAWGPTAAPLRNVYLPLTTR